MSFSSPITVIKKQPLPTHLRYTASLNNNSLRHHPPTFIHSGYPKPPRSHIQTNRNTTNHRGYFYNGSADQRRFETRLPADQLMIPISTPPPVYKSSSSASSTSFSSNNSSQIYSRTNAIGNTSQTSQNTNLKSHNMMPSVTSRLKKNISRTKEKILQGIGKTDRTSDESFDLYVENFERQHSQASKLTKELNKYLSCLKETQKSSRMFYETLKETYEPTWPGNDLFSEQIQLIEIKWNEYVDKLVNDVQSPLVAYLNEFPELKKKIEKRDNRLLDFDNARHTLESVQHKTSKRSGANTLATTTTTPGTHTGNSSNTSSSSTEQLTKLTKLKIDLEDKQHIYEEINQTLCMALPVLFENRIKFYSSLFQTFFYTETLFHSDCVEVKSKLDDMCENLSTQTAQQISNSKELYALACNEQQQQQHVKKPPVVPPPPHFIRNEAVIEHEQLTNDERHVNGVDRHNSSNIVYIESSNEPELRQDVVLSSKTEFCPINVKEDIKNGGDEEEPLDYDSSQLESIENFLNKSLKHLELSPIISIEKTKANSHQPQEDAYARVEPAQIEHKTSKQFVYKVKATYAYEAKELDELTFVKDDLIDVVECTESEAEDLDDGWLIGVHETSLKRGLFPANFTKRI